MDVNELVRTITREVLQQMHGQKKNDCIMVMAERSPLLAGQINEKLGCESELFFWGEDTQDQSVCRYILPFLPCGDMADLAAGRAGGPYMTEVLQLLLRGTEVEVMEFGHRAYSETAPGPLYALYESYVETLAGFGLKPFQPKRPDSVRHWQLLVTEKVVNEAGEQHASTLMVPVKAQITPLAAEAARNLNIQIQKCL